MSTIFVVGIGPGAYEKMTIEAADALRNCDVPAAGPHPLVLLLRDLDPEELSPLAALKLIMEWKKLWADAPDTEEKHV